MVEYDSAHLENQRMDQKQIRLTCQRVLRSTIFQHDPNLSFLLGFLVQRELSNNVSLNTKDNVLSHVFGDYPKIVAEQKLTFALTRLSEKLDQYYEGEGLNDPIIIKANTIQACLTFEENENSNSNEGQILVGRQHRNVSIPITFYMFILSVFLFSLCLIDFGSKRISHGQKRENHIGTQFIDSSIGSDYSELSVGALELTSRRFLFPFQYIKGKKKALEIAREVILRDPAYAPGYATAGYALASQSLMTTGGGLSKRYLSEALAMRDKAMDLDPDHPWVIASAGLIAYVDKDFERAVFLLETAYERARLDDYIANTYMSVAFVTHRYKLARDAALRFKLHNSKNDGSTPARIYAYANFHLGYYEETIDTLEAVQLALDQDHDVAPLVYLAAAYQAIGRHEAARSLIKKIQSERPLFRPDLMGSIFLQDPNEANFLIQSLTEAGWPELSD